MTGALTTEDRAARYCAAALERTCSEIATTCPGGRNNAVNAAAYSLGRLVGGNILGYEQAQARLQEAATAAGLAPLEAASAVKHLDAIVGRVGHVDTARGINGYVVRKIE